MYPAFYWHCMPSEIERECKRKKRKERGEGGGIERERENGMRNSKLMMKKIRRERQSKRKAGCTRYIAKYTSLATWSMLLYEYKRRASSATKSSQREAARSKIGAM